MTEAGRKLTIAPALTDALLDDVQRGGGSDALPLLAFTLEQLYLDFHQAGALALADYQASGGIKGTIEAAVARVFARADADPRIPRDQAAREALLRRGLIPWLAGVDPDSKTPRRNIARRSDIPAEAAPLIDLLVEERLLIADMSGETATIEPAHEALLRQWGLLEGWVAEDFGLLATLEAVKRASRDWDGNARAEAWLAHQGQRLTEASSLDARPDIAAKLDSVDRAYLAGCRAREEAVRAEATRREEERAEEERRRLADAQALAAANGRVARRTQVGLLVALVLAVFASGGFFYAWSQQKLANANAAEAIRQEAVSRANQAAALAAVSGVKVATDPIAAVKLALAAWPRIPNDRLPQLQVTLDALGKSVMANRSLHSLDGVLQDVYSAAFSNDSALIVTAASHPPIQIWDVKSGRKLFDLPTEDVGKVGFSSDKRRIAT